MSSPDNNLEQYEALINNPEPIALENPAYEQILKDLQGGTIKSSGRNYSLYIFIQFGNEKVKDVKQWIRDQAKSITFTWKQQKQTETYNRIRQQDLSFSGELCKNFYYLIKVIRLLDSIFLIQSLMNKVIGDWNLLYKNRGGEFFFVPSISFLEKLAIV